MPRAKGLSRVQRTLRVMRQSGRICAIVEKFNFYAGPRGRREDLFGIIDILALDPVSGFVGVQVCGSSDWNDHLHKMMVLKGEKSTDWLETGVICPDCGRQVGASQLELWGWRKLKKGQGYRWAPKIARFYIDDQTLKYEIITDGKDMI